MAAIKVFVWQWGRRGAGPRIAATLAEALAEIPDVKVILSLSAQAEILSGSSPPRVDLPVHTYAGVGGYVARWLEAPLTVRGLSRQIAAYAPDFAICAMPGPLDSLALWALQRIKVPAVVVVHDADIHPGDGLPFQMWLQRRLARDADGLVALSEHVAQQLRDQGLAGRAGGKPLFVASLPPLVFGPPPPPPLAHGGRLRMLSFGRLLPYKGLDLLADALALLGPRPDLELRVVGSGPQSDVLARLAAMPNVTVENRWVPEAEIGHLLGWADAVVLSHREASQSGVAAAAIAAGRLVVATRVGGLAEQLRDESLARLCEPNAASLAAAIRGLLDEPPRIDPAESDPHTAWRNVAETLLRDITAALQLELRWAHSSCQVS
jgi:glycosyltransferase involved in cell wall biosynthesis